MLYVEGVDICMLLVSIIIDTEVIPSYRGVTNELHLVYISDSMH